MGLNMKDTGKTICSTVMGKKFGQMDLVMMGITTSGRNKEKVTIFYKLILDSVYMITYTLNKDVISGLMDQNMMVNGMIIKFRGKEITFGQMEEFMMDIGLIITCMAKEFILGKMAENMKENIKMIKNQGKFFYYKFYTHFIYFKDMVFSNGQMEEDM